MDTENRWNFVTTAADRAAFFASSDPFDTRLLGLAKAYADEIRAALRPDDVPVFVLPVQVHHEGKKPPCMALLLQERAVLLWSTGFVRMKNHSAVIPYNSVTSVELDGVDGMRVHAENSWYLGGFRDPAPILRDMVAATLRGQFTCGFDESGDISTLEFTELGISMNFGDDDET